MVEIIIKISLGEIIEKYDWDRLCVIKRWSTYIVNEGVADSNEITELSLAEASYIGINVAEILEEKGNPTICPHCMTEITGGCPNCEKRLREL